MPLNKDVCKFCVCGNNEWSAARNRIWNGNDDSRWEIGTVACSFSGKGSMVVMPSDNPPEWCKFVLEHTVSTVVGT